MKLKLAQIAFGILVSGSLIGAGATGALADWDGSLDDAGADESWGAVDSTEMFPSGFPFTVTGMMGTLSDASWDDSDHRSESDDDSSSGGWDDHGSDDNGDHLESHEDSDDDGSHGGWDD